MSEDAEKTEAPTARRRSDARKRGQVAKSVELTSVAVLFGMIIVLNSFMHTAIEGVIGYFEHIVRHLDVANFSQQRFQQDNLFAITTLARILMPILFTALAIGVTINVVQVGPLWATEALKPNFQKLNPLSGLKNFVSMRSFVEVFKNFYKIGICAWITYNSVRDSYPKLMVIWRMDLRMAVGIIGELIYSMTLHIVGTMLVLAGLDYAFQRYSLEKQLRMTKEEVKQESKGNEFNPQLKARIRQKQREMSKKRMMDSVPTADVVVTNPTHFAVALKYSPDNSAPIVVAKGVDLLAFKIREIAIDADVPIVENPPLARALYRQVDIGREIPHDLYQAVAEVLAFVYEVNRRRKERARMGITWD
ncbi:hypothetical protein LBMAG21_04910 [Armatimonadota bacterium]|nr:hypothetical protein LBMAG21_04910 [Armatimonadota bacterium]